MRPFTHTIPFQDALRIVRQSATPIGRIETVPLADADGRVAAADVVAPAPVPPFARAAMDGYAVRTADISGASAASQARLVCVDRVLTGEVPSQPVLAGRCIEIATGAPVPPGADAVVMVEQTTRDGDAISFLTPARDGQNISRRGSDLVEGATVVASGAWLTPARVGALAATGATTASVFVRPRVALLSTGNEVVEPGRPLGPGQIYDINRATLAAVVHRHGGVATSLPIAGDDLESLQTALDMAASHDVIVCSGGSSVGERDLTLDAIRARGQVVFHGIAVKPGKPTAFGHAGNTPIFSMPGSPTSCLSNAYLLLVPFLRLVAHLPPWEPKQLEAPLARTIAANPDRHQFYTVRLVDGRAEPAFKASGDITSMAGADGYIEIPVSTPPLEAGTRVTVNLFGW
jgi:molybdopterin molybdotransferase